MKSNISIASLLLQATQTLDTVSDSPRLDAEVLLAHCLGCNRAYLFAWPEKVPTKEQTERFLSTIEKRSRSIPLAHLTSEREFWSLNFKVTKDTLIPRPETELLVELALKILNEEPGPILDLGTGSGNIAISIAYEMPGLRVDAIDQSDAALNVAKHNMARNNVTINLRKSDWFSKVEHRDYQIIASNPPYLDALDPHLCRDGLQYEPATALIADENGLAAIKTIIANAADYAVNCATILIEHGNTQGSTVRALMEHQGFQQITTHRDIESRERVTLARMNK